MKKFLDWLESFWKKTKVEEEIQQASSYVPQDRVLFVYNDGEKSVTQDPMVLFKKMLPHCPDIFKEMKAIRDLPDDDSKFAETLTSYTDRVSKAFNLKPFDPETEKGLTLIEQVMVFNAYFCFLRDRVGKMLPHSHLLAGEEAKKEEPKKEETFDAEETP